MKNKSKICGIIIYVSMDYEEKKRRQLVRVVIAEAGMVISVIAIVVVATMVAMGFFISDKGTIEQSGLIQLRSLPTGATVELDGATLFARTNLQRSVAPGEHHLKLSRDGYDTWEKNIKMAPGVLMRIYYPRLFLLDRKAEQVLTLGAQGASDGAQLGNQLEFYLSSKDRNYILYALNDAAEWRILDLRGDEVKETILDLSGILPGMVTQPEDKYKKEQQNGEKAPSYRFEGTVEKMVWSENNEKVLVRVKVAEETSWILVNLRDVAKSLNLTKSFGLKFDQVTMIDSSANQLYALENQQLRKINTADESMSKVLLDKIATFVNYEGNLVYLSPVRESRAKDGTVVQEVGVYRDGEAGSTIIKTITGETSVKIALARYYNEDYICYTEGSELNIIYGNFPSYRPEGANLEELKELVSKKALAVVPDILEVSPDDDYVVAKKGAQFMVTDLEMGDVYEYEAEATEIKWLDDSMMFAVRNKEIIVWDFDHSNLRNLGGENVVDRAVTITENGRYMYYLVENKKGTLDLTREKIRN